METAAKPERTEPARALVETGTVAVDGVSTFYRRLDGEGPPTVFVHGVPTHSEDWIPFMSAMRGPALALDLPGFGRSQHPQAGAFDHSMRGYSRFFARFLEAMEVDRFSLVVHDWGVVGLVDADPGRIERLVVINAVPLLPGYRWHRLARIWRTHGLGELSSGLWRRDLLDYSMRESRGDWSRHSGEFIDMIYDHLDPGTFRAILGLYRSADPERLAAAGESLSAMEAPALVVWGLKDRYLPGRFGAAYAERLPRSELWELPQAGHWPWIEDASVIERVTAFLSG